MGQTGATTSGGPPDGGKPAWPLGGEGSAWLMVMHPLEPGLIGKRLLVTSLGFGIGCRRDDFVVRGANDTVATIQGAASVIGTSWAIRAMCEDVEVNEDRVVGTRILTTGDEIRVLGNHFVFLCGEALEAQSYKVIYHLTIKDFATGLFNARYLDEALNQELRRAADGGTPLSVAVVRLETGGTSVDAERVQANQDLMRRFSRSLRARTSRNWTLALARHCELVVVARDTSGALLDSRVRQAYAEFSGASAAPIPHDARCGVVEWTASSTPSSLLDQARQRCSRPLG